METFVPRGEKLGKGFTKREQIAGTEVRPQHKAAKGQSRANWISDLLALRRILILCSYCREKFNPRKVNYRRVFVPDQTGKSDGYTVNGYCDGCNSWTPDVGGGTAFQPEEDYLATHVDPTVARRQARASARELGTWDFINRR